MVKVERQHGDVILHKSEIPQGAKRINFNSKTFIIEKGEGIHTHIVTDECLPEVLEVYEHEGTLYFKTNKALTITHEEHREQTLDPGVTYKKVIEREFDYEDMEARKTID